MKDKPRAGRRAVPPPPPEQVVAVNAVACDLPVRYGLPLGRFSRTELYWLVIELAVVGVDDLAMLHEDAIRPSADEKSQLQALGRRRETSAPGPGRRNRYELEYERGGTLAYLACGRASRQPV